MNKKKIFLFSQALNLFFFMLLGAGLYWYQTHTLRTDIVRYYQYMTDVLYQESTDRRDFYHHWANHLYEQPQWPAQYRERLFKAYDITYVGAWSGDTLVAIPPFTKKPPFFNKILKQNEHFLFYRDNESLYFIYNFTPPGHPMHTVVQKETRDYLINRAKMANAKILFTEKEVNFDPSALYSNLKETQVKDFFKKYPETQVFQHFVTLEDEHFIVIQKTVFESKEYRQTMTYFYDNQNLFAVASFGVAAVLLALFCVTSYLLFVGYLKSRD